MPAKILPPDEAYKAIEELKSQGKCVVFTNGCFDLIHPGHTRFLQQARSLGDVLIVALNTDASIRYIKGPGRPILPEGERAEIIAALRGVDLVTFFDDPTPRQMIARMLPDVLVKGGDWAIHEIVGREEVEAAGGKVVSIPYIAGCSTSSIIDTVVERFGR